MIPEVKMGAPNHSSLIVSFYLLVLSYICQREIV